MPTAKRKSAAKTTRAKPKLTGQPIYARVFRNGRSNAIRIPAALDPGCKEVELTPTKDGGFLVKPKRKLTEAEFWARLQEARAMIPADFMLDREQPPMPEDGPSPFDA